MSTVRTALQIAKDIVNGDTRARAELEKMMGKKLEEMTQKEAQLGVMTLATFEKHWNVNK